MDVLIAAFLFCIGAVVASFIGVIVERIYTGQSWTKGRSRCDSCSETLQPIDLIPIASWLAAKGKCRYCGVRVAARYAVTELFFGVLCTLAFWKLGLSLSLVFFLGALASLLFVVLYDLKHTIVPTIGWMVLLAFSVLYAFSAAIDTYSLSTWFMTAGITGLFFFLIYFFSKGKAMGLGDTPVSIALALLAGYSAFSGFLFSFWIGAAVGICILVMRRGGPTMGIEVPFVPFLAAGYLLAFFTQWQPFLF